jgi:type 1 glutamine amidotransferase
MKVKGSTAPLLAAVCTAALLAVGVGIEAQTPAAGAQPAAPAQGRGGRGGGGGGLNEPCGGRSQNPKEACPGDVTKMQATVGLLPAKPPATPEKPRKVLLFSRIPSAGYQHSSIPLAMRTIDELGKHTGAWTTDTAWDPAVFTADNLKQYDAIFLSSTTGCFLDDPNDQATTDARRQALLDFVRSGKGVAGIHATGDSYHGTSCGGGGAARAGAAGRAGRAGGRAGGNAARGGRANFTPLPPCSHRNDGPGGGGQALWPAWNQMIGGYFKFHWVYPSPITVKIDDPSNPINAPFKGQAFDTIDEVYTFAQDSWSRKNVHVLTSIDYSQMTDCQKGLEESPRTDHDFGLSWIRRDGQGRVFYEALGHSETIYYNNPAMLEHLLAGMQYVLGDLKADDSPSQK